jgi:hypothetical protein
MFKNSLKYGPKLSSNRCIFLFFFYFFPSHGSNTSGIYMTRIRDDTFEVSNEIGQYFVLLKSTNSPGKKKSGLIQCLHP